MAKSEPCASWLKTQQCVHEDAYASDHKEGRATRTGAARKIAWVAPKNIEAAFEIAEEAEA